ncbi:MAG: DUF899 family protein [Burkholderiales bacterium]
MASSSLDGDRPDHPDRHDTITCRNRLGPEGQVFHTCSTCERGIDMMSVDYQFLDLVPKGRDEGGRGPYWVRHHDEYGR